MGYLDQICHTYLFTYCPSTYMQNGDEGLPNISLAGRGILVTIFITLEPHVYFYQVLQTNIF